MEKYTCYGTCVSIMGNYTSNCKWGFSGDPKIKDSCRRKSLKLVKCQNEYDNMEQCVCCLIVEPIITHALGCDLMTIRWWIDLKPVRARDIGCPMRKINSPLIHFISYLFTDGKLRGILITNCINTWNLFTSVPKCFT